MASQQILFAETIAESDSDSEIESYSNRGNKLKKQARFARQGQLVPNNGPSSYKEYVEYGGVRRPILYRNPPLVDEEGYEIDSDDEDEERVQEAEASAAEMNPYANIQIERKPVSVESQTSPDIALRRLHMGPMRNDAQHLLALSQAISALPRITNGAAQQASGVEQANAVPDTTFDGEPTDKDPAEDADITMTDAGTADPDDSLVEDADDNAKVEAEKDGAGTASNMHNGEQLPAAQTDKRDSMGEATNGVNEHTNEQGTNETEVARAEATAKPSGSDAHQQTESAETIRADVSMISDGDDDFIHPMFLAPSGARPDRDIGLPDQEAEDIRRLLALYVQKQEEVCRGAKRLFLGLLKAEQMRKNVLHWSKAEAHSGLNRDMSDGEDWYDKEEWGLTEDLKKGQDEEEEDVQTTGKKTRNRRQ
ncbi:uncharacterized protein FFUJ_06121 [Fusarium fujikuroi IMI 58289]|uniref:Transcriptional regulatory protein RXT2 N-terminal domain-containing protein n=1 Tax=Gibberella fujikuroi (strain CBS 195.34 / IMI 58289 / NRRL A-6831) TaxID=1279085 RepID=S0ECR1_GIBF5|nr:uncharacterized protein FFUJ_06121 [Fusarium fujikuroi IMI 58289]KLO96800.1 uncharacterized protein LW94_12464 [Fusarium fujikuroi]CCT70173.1 uncharacterized protein FFUJ_06121 [Fusarium fujikuroi IMI 58289]